jgi:(S)-ureidoglycine-glyoxylate aminotransferase
MPLADLQLPTRLLAGGGPSTPDPRVLRALATPLIGQFDPDFTAIMDDVAQLARQTFVTTNQRCFAVSALASGGLEAVLNSLVEDGDAVAIGGGPTFVTIAAGVARRYGARVVAADADDEAAGGLKFLVVPFVDPTLGQVLPVRDLANAAHAKGVTVIVDATFGLAACELRVDDWAIDVCVAGVDHAIGAPPGMTLITYAADVEARLSARAAPPKTSYLDLVQLQAYWSPERLNHHTAPTSLVYGLREALRLVQTEGLAELWERHRRIGEALSAGVRALGLDTAGDTPFVILHLPSSVDETAARRALLDDFGVYVTQIGARTWRLGLLGAEARHDAVQLVLAALEKVLKE